MPRFTPSLLIVALTLFLPSERSHAINTAVGTGDWFNPFGWTSGVPMNGDFETDVRISSDSNLSISTGHASVHNFLRIGSTGSVGNSGELEISGGTFTAAGNDATGQNEIGSSGGSRHGLLDIQGGLVEFQNLRVHLGAGTTNTGYITQSGGTALYGDQLRIGATGVGIANYSSGLSSVNGQVQVGVNPSGVGMMMFNTPLSGPAHHAILGDHLTIGLNGVGVLHMEDGVLEQSVTDRDLRFGLNAGSVGTGIITGGRFESGRSIYIGQSGSGALDVSGGTVTSAAVTLVGSLATGLGDLRVSGGLVDVGTGLRVGVSGTGFTSVSGGAVDVFESVIVGLNAGSLGSMHVSGGLVRSGLDVTATNSTIGNAGEGVLEVSGGTFSHRRSPGLESGNIRVGGASGGKGKIIVSGDGLLETNGSIFVGTTGTSVAVAAQGELVVNGGRVALERELQIGTGTKSFGSLNMSGGLIQTDIPSVDGVDSLGGAITIGQGGTAALTLTGGTIETGVSGLGEFRFGFRPGSLGVGEISGGLVTANVFVAGKGSPVTFDAAADGLTSDGTASGDTLPAVGDLTVSGGTIVVGAGFQVGQLDDSIGSLTMTGGFINVTNDFRLGVSPVFTDGDGISSFNGSNAARGFATITGGTIIANDFEAAVDGTGEATIGGNAQLTLRDALHAASGSGSGTLHITDNANLSIGSFIAVAPGQDNNGGNGILNVSGNATLTAAKSFNISSGTATSGVANITGGHIVIAEDLTIKSAIAAAGALHQSGGTLIVDGAIDASNGAVHTFSGGVLTRGSAGNIAYDGTLTISSTATIRLDDDKTMSVTGGFDATGGGIFDLTGTTLTLGDGEYFFLTLGDGTGALGGDNFTDNTSLDFTIDLVGLDPLTANRVAESVFELGLFNPLTDDVYALVHDQTTDRIGLRWHLVPEPSRLIMLAIALTATLLRRRQAT